MPNRKIVPDVVQNQDLVTVEPSLTVRAAAMKMAERRIGAVMVLEGGALRGIFTERDVLNRVVARGLDPDQTRVAEVMTADPVTLGPDDTADSALELMGTRGFRHLPVVKDGRVLAMVSIRDLYAAIQVQLQEDIKEREAFIFGTSYGTSP
ncbi:MAG TPA: CBS domain-containing protein [Alphaproteobacteria bacterium]|nr:CBS domain-containing protein [Alphaproteobacteria bacterium]